MYNNYGFNPYYQPQRFQPTEPINMQSRAVLNGKVVDSIDVVKSTDIPLDGSISYFPLADGSAIVCKQLQIDGTSKITIYRPVNEENNIIRYVTAEDLDKIKLEIKEIKDKLNVNGDSHE